MSATQRREAIKHMLEAETVLSVSHLSNALHVTEETIRRDLTRMEAEGILTRTFGGARILPPEVQTNIGFVKRTQVHVNEKRRIARVAAEYLVGKRTIALDASSTSVELMSVLKARPDLTILTNSAVAPIQLVNAPVTLFSTGGQFDESTMSFTGQGAKDAISRFHVEVFVMSCKGLDLDAGITDSHEMDAEVKCALIEQADKIVLLADDSKFSRKAFVKLSDLADVSCIITNKEPSDEWKNALDALGIKVLY